MPEKSKVNTKHPLTFRVDCGMVEGMETIKAQSGIYTIVHTGSGQRYIGSSENIAKRWWEHRNSLKNKSHVNAHLQNAWNKYGAESFKFSVIEHCRVEDLLSREQVYIDEKSEYNICLIAGRTIGVKRRPETIRKMKESQTNWAKNPENKDKIAKSIAILNSPEVMAKSAAGVRTPKERARRSKWAQDHKEDSSKRLNSPEVRDKINAAIRTPEARKKRSETMKLRMADPAMIAATQSESANKKRSDAMKKRWADPDNRARQSEKMKDRWLDPERRKDMLSAINEGHSRKKEINNARES